MPKAIDLTGQRFGKLLVLERTEDYVSPKGKHSRVWRCKCDCGNIKNVGHYKLKNGRTKSCGCLIKTSFPEQALYYYIKQIFPDAINSDKHLGVELDIYIPSLDVAIEYDGEVWHNKNRTIKVDLRKNQLCINNNIELIRVREQKCVTIENCTVFYREDNYSNLSLDIVISDVLRYLTSSITMDIDTTRDTPIILSQYATKQYENSLSYCYPDIAKEWHPTKNGTLTPDKVFEHSDKTVWWLGKCGHEWQSPISSRTTYNSGCPICLKKRKSPSVICIETNKRFENGLLASKFANIKCTKNIYNCCRGKYKTAGGYHWKFADDTIA